METQGADPLEMLGTLLMGNVELMGRNPWKNENLPTSKRYEFEN